MLEIVFGQSAAGSLKIAQGFGRGKYAGGCASVALLGGGGAAASPEEIEAKRREIEEQHRLEWEQAAPLGGSSADVFGFDLALGFGDIAEENFWENRACALSSLCACWPGVGEEEAKRRVQDARKDLAVLMERARTESARIWCSANPDDACGMCWMLAQLNRVCADVRLVRLPEYIVEGDTLKRYSGWGEVSPGEWHRFLKYEESAPMVLRRSCVARWRELQQENMPLRAVLGGEIHSLPADFYDTFIRRELADMPGAQQAGFRQAHLIGNVLGKYRLGIGDGYIALRMEYMIESGELQVLSRAGEGEPTYRRVLRWNPS